MFRAKKAQVGVTLTWFFAFLLICVIIFLFLAFSSMIFAKRVPTRLLSSITDKFFGSTTLYEGRELDMLLLSSLLQGNAEWQAGNSTLFDLVRYWAMTGNSEVAGVIKNKIVAVISQHECYYFYIPSQKLSYDALVLMQGHGYSKMPTKLIAELDKDSAMLRFGEAKENKIYLLTRCVK